MDVWSDTGFQQVIQDTPTDTPIGEQLHNEGSSFDALGFRLSVEQPFDKPLPSNEPHPSDGPRPSDEPRLSLTVWPNMQEKNTFMKHGLVVFM